MVGPRAHARLRGRDRRALLAAGVWLALLLGVALAQGALASPAAPTDAPLNPGAVVTLTPPGLLTPEPTVPQPTPTTPATPPPTATPTRPVATPTPPPSDGGGDHGGGGGGGGGVIPVGPQPTRVVFEQPSINGGNDGPLQAFSPAGGGANGLLIATALGCITSVLGLIIAVISMTVLLRGGYGPFLRVLVLGKRAANGAEAGGVSSRTGGRGRADVYDDDDEDGFPRRGRGSGADRYASSRYPAASSRRSGPNRGRGISGRGDGWDDGW